MTSRGVTALERLSRCVVGLEATLDDSDWSRPSGCPGWSNHDVLIHLVCTLREIVVPESLPGPFAGGIERTNDLAVAAFRGERPDQTLDTYRRLLAPALEALVGMREEPAASAPVDFDDAGSCPAHLIADSLAFDHYCHLRHDLAAPRGTVEALKVTADETVMAASLTWLLAGLPHGQRITVEPNASPHAGALITTSADSFHLWGTHRQPWRETDVDVRGDEKLAADVLDALRVF
ncbi:maleylpyruvate isomerase N-terminal domain-containing protein [Streptomyces sp. 4F14]|uniref:maleylpyruvate isomerase N-terminal domain-containing protein n=1 Tax=Streptomyces sp. 4F14 TaxID=3394380 RepID=UPI003A84D2A5